MPCDGTCEGQGNGFERAERPTHGNFHMHMPRRTTVQRLQRCLKLIPMELVSGCQMTAPQSSSMRRGFRLPSTHQRRHVLMPKQLELVLDFTCERDYPSVTCDHHSKGHCRPRKSTTTLTRYCHKDRKCSNCNVVESILDPADWKPSSWQVVPVGFVSLLFSTCNVYYRNNLEAARYSRPLAEPAVPGQPFRAFSPHSCKTWGLKSLYTCLPRSVQIHNGVLLGCWVCCLGRATPTKRGQGRTGNKKVGRRGPM